VTPSEDAGELELASRASRGDADAFRTIYERYRKMVYGLALSTCGRPTDAEDVLQDAFLRVHRSLPRFRGESKLSTWIWRVALSVALSHRRSARRRGPHTDEGLEEAASTAPPPEASLAVRDERDFVAARVAELPRRDSAILHLRYAEGRSFEEISQILDMPVGTAKSLVFRAKAELRRNLERDGHAL